jgi:hypothetical protein
MKREFIIMLVLFAICMLAACSNGGKTGGQLQNPVPVEELEEIDRAPGLYPATVNTPEGLSWGYIDSSGNFAILPVFDRAEEFQDNGLAVVTKGNFSGLIDKNGQYVAEPQYDYIQPFSDGVAIGYRNKSYDAIDERGRVLFTSKDDYVSEFHEGRAAFNRSVGERYLHGYFDEEGNTAIEPRFPEAYDFNEGKAVVRLQDDTYAMIDRTGKIIKSFPYAYVGNRSEGLLPFRETKEGKTGYINEKGDVVIKPSFLEAGSFTGGRAVVSLPAEYPNIRYGLIDKKGKYLIKPEYNYILILGEGMSAAGIALNKEFPYMGSKYAIVDAKGNFLTDFLYYEVSEFKNGYASVDDGQSTYFIDKTGKRVESLPKVEGNGRLALRGDLVQAMVDGRYLYLTRTGDIIYRQNETIPLSGGLAVVEKRYRPNRNYLVFYPQLQGMKDTAEQDAVNEKLKQLSITKEVTPEQEMDFSYDGSFTIAFYQKNLLVLELIGYDYPFGAAHGMPIRNYVHLDLKSGHFYTLEELFKKDSAYIKRLSDIIRKQIEEKGEEMGVWLDSYAGIRPDQPFYITKDALMIYFQPYEIASYAAGFPTFRIPYGEIGDLINTESAFWKSFH